MGDFSGWGKALGKIFDWVPGRKEAKLGKIESINKKIKELEDEKQRLFKVTPFTVRESIKIQDIDDAIDRLDAQCKQLQSQADRIT